MASGHRPQYLECKYDETHEWLIDLKHKLYTWLHHNKSDIEYTISGMALGFDTWFAEECLKLRIPVHAYIPFVGQELYWVNSAQERYNNILKACDNINITSREYSKRVFLDRDKNMVSNATDVAALYNPSIKTGGTYYTIEYAKKNNLNIHNFWKGSQNMFRW